MRRRLTVAVLLPEPVSTEVQGLRRALGDPALDRYVPHITLMPPVNVNEADLAAAIDLVRTRAAGQVPMTVRVTGPARFDHERPVTYLAVDAPNLTSLHDQLHTRPLHEQRAHHFVPHITIGRGEFDITTLDYENEFKIDRIYVLERGDKAIWHPVADMAFEAPSIVGRGGIELELSTTQMLDPIAARLLRPRTSDLVVTARHENEVVGVAVTTFDGSRADLDAFFVVPAMRGKGIAHKLLAHLVHRCQLAGRTELVNYCTPSEKFLESRGWQRTGSHLSVYL